MAYPWKGYTNPFRIFGNLYFVGTVPASTHIIDTGAGLIMIDPGYPQSLYLVIDNMYRLGLDPHDPEIFDTYTMDGLHFNDAGHAVIAQKLKDFIEAI